MKGKTINTVFNYRNTINLFLLSRKLLQAIVAVRESIESRFTDHKDSPVFENLVDLLETKA